MRIFAVMFAVVMVFSVLGCGEKTASEEMKADMQSASKKMEKELDSWR